MTDQYLYSFGGRNLDAPPDLSDPIWTATRPLFQELWRFSLRDRIWTKLTLKGQPPVGLSNHCMALWDEHKLIVYGGSCTPSGKVNSNKLYIGDLKKMEWSLVEYSNPNDGKSGQR